jgi:TRAP-type C4-dicarboxylate transport system permease large subunit
MGALLRECWPFLVAMVAALALVTVWPSFVLVLPRMAGYAG